MANKTFIPAFEAKVGDWTYYICVMKYAEVRRSVQFAHELGGNRDLSTLIQRGIGKRTEGIIKYLLGSEHRFLGSLVIAAWGGSPDYVRLSMDDPEGMLKDLDQGFGVLTLDGTHQFFALDGQHRLKAIRDTLNQRPDLGAEDICVLLVPHYDTEIGRVRTRRLFTNINRNAKTTTTAENIALDVDDGYAVLTRRFLTDHYLLKRPGMVKVFTKPPTEEGEFSLAGSSIPKTEARAWTTITVLYELLKNLGFDLDRDMNDLSSRPSDDVLDTSYDTLSKRMEDILDACGGLKSKLEAGESMRELRSPKAEEGHGHPLMRPVVQKAVTNSIAHLVSMKKIDWPGALECLRILEWRIDRAPWLAVFNPKNTQMITAKENTELLVELLNVHTAPQSKAEVERARRHYREIMNNGYPIAVEALLARLGEQGRAES